MIKNHAIKNFVLLSSFSQKVRDICEMQIDAVLQDISETTLINLHDDRPSSLQDLVTVNEVLLTVTVIEILRSK